MKKFFLHDGTEQQGPFDIEDLKLRNISKVTPIWYEGLSQWTTAGNIDDLKQLFVTPPPFKQQKTTPPPIEQIQTKVINQPTKKKNRVGTIFFSIVLVCAFIFIMIFGINYFSQNFAEDADTQTYQEKVMTVEEIELTQPCNFLIVNSEYDENFWGTKIKLHGIIKNVATVATYKDAVVKVIFYSKTETILGSENYTIYETFFPNSETKFELTLDKYKDVNSIGVEIETAIAN